MYWKGILVLIVAIFIGLYGSSLLSFPFSIKLSFIPHQKHLYKISYPNSEIPIAAENKDYATMLLLYAQGGDLNSRDKWGKTAVYYLAKYGEWSLIEALSLLDQQLDLNAASISGATPLMAAGERFKTTSDSQTKDTLLKLKANPNCQNIDGKTWLYFSNPDYKEKEKEKESTGNSIIKTQCNEYYKSTEALKTLEETVNAVHSASNDPRLRLLTFNIRYGDRADFTTISWARRFLRVTNLIRLLNPSVFGLQEVLYEQLKDISSVFPDYQFVGVGRDNGKEKGEFAPLFYNANQFTLLDSSTFWLSQVPHIAGSRSWGAKNSRIVTWAKLQDKKSKTQFIIFNTHFDHESYVSRVESAKLIIKKIQEISTNEMIFVMGDFNMGESEEGCKQMSTFFENSRKKAQYQSGMDRSFTGFFGEAWGVIDHIFYKPSGKEKMTVYQHSIINDIDEVNIYSSDHRPVLADFLIPEFNHEQA